MIHPTPPPSLQFPLVTVEEPTAAVDVDAPQPSPPVKAAEEAAAIKVVVEHTSDGAHAAEQAPVALLPPHVPAERLGHHLHPSQHLLPLQSVNNIFKSYCFLVSSKACCRLVFGRVTRRTRLPRVIGSCENLPGYPDTRYIANCAKIL